MLVAGRNRELTFKSCLDHALSVSIQHWRGGLFWKQMLVGVGPLPTGHENHADYVRLELKMHAWAVNARNVT